MQVVLILAFGLRVVSFGYMVGFRSCCFGLVVSFLFAYDSLWLDFGRLCFWF